MTMNWETALSKQNGASGKVYAVGQQDVGQHWGKLIYTYSCNFALNKYRPHLTLIYTELCLT